MVGQDRDFQVPSLTFAGINFEIKYLNWYQYNPPIAPFFRYDTGWTQWGQLPIGTTGSAGVYIEIPTTQFGYDVPATDMFAEVYIQNAGLTIVRQINPNPVYTGTGTTHYGFQILKDTANNIRLEFADGGLAYYASGGYTAIDNTWTYRIMLYKTERFNKFYDYLADQKLQQLWTLNLVNLTASITTAGPGYFDRGAVAPSGTTRLNYSGDFYATDFFSTANTTVGGNLSVTGTSGFSNTVTVGSLNIQTSGNLTTSGNLATTGSGQLSIGGTSGFTGLATFGALTANGAVTLNNTLTLKNGATTEFSVDTFGNVYTNGTITSVYTGGLTALSLQGTSSFAGLATFTNGFVVGAGGGTTGNSTFNLPIILNQALTQYNLGIQTFQALSNGNLSTTGSITTTGGSGNLSISGTSIFTGLMTVGVNGIDGPATTALYPTPTTITFGSNATTFSIGNATGGGAGNLTLYSASTVLSGNTSVTSGTLTLGSSSRDGLLNFYTNGGSGVNAFISNSTSAKTLTISQNLNSGNVIVQIFGATVATFNQTGVIAAGFDTTSKRVLKDNIQKFDEKAMDILSNIEVVSYNFKADPQKKLKIGFIADDTHEYLSGKEHDRMDISNTLGLLIKAVQELKNEVDEIRRG